MKVVTRILTGILLTAVAVLVFAGVVYPFYIVPKQYEDKATELTMARVEAGGIEVDPGYITESINEAMTKDLDRIFKEALLIAAAAALILFCLTIRPPHDHGGINLFNPIYLVPVAGISLLTGAAICLILSSMRGAEVNGFLFFVKGLTENYEFTYERLLLMILIPIGLELIFRGVIFSFIEKLHFSLAIVVSTVMYAFAAYYIVGAYTKWSLGSNVPGMCAFWIALGIGGVHAIVTWRLRSVIPAVLSHLLLVFSAGRIAEYCAENSPSLALVLTLLGVLLLALVLLPTIFGKKVKVLAYDFPLTKHHERMYGWLYGRREKKAAETETKQAEAVEEAEKKTEEVPSRRSGRSS